MKITQEEIEQIFNEVDSKWEGDNAFQGLQILSKYTNNLIQGAGHDVIWSVDVEYIIELGITKEDITKLSLLNWTIEEDCLACFV
ncbi:MAG: hypothetical protein LC112_11080 [Flavobacteriales bacterium]|nr:hypothetical protein [Flavobacteriales bacterium]